MVGAFPDEGDDNADASPRKITLSEHDLRAAKRILKLLLGVPEDPRVEVKKGIVADVMTSGDPDRNIFVKRARQTLTDRSRRSRNFNSAMFGEAAWDMLLALYVSEQTTARHTVSGLLNYSGVPPSTALRWLDFLEREQLISRQPSPTDRRVFLIKLTEKGRDSLDSYFSQVGATGIPTK